MPETTTAHQETPLQAQRRRIDEIDREIVDLLNQRALIAMSVAKSKESEGLPEFSPAREAQVLTQVDEANRGPLTQAAVRAVFSEVISACRAVQKPLKVAFLGPEATYSHQAALTHFGASSRFAPQRTIEDVFQEVDRGHSQVGVVPVENSSEGGVSVTLDLFLDSDLNVCGEIYTKVRHVLMSNEESLDAIKTVYSHPQALAHCRNWLRRNVPLAVQVETPSTAGAAVRAAQEPGAAAVGSKLAARTQNLNLLAVDIQDNPNNTTRFFVLGRQTCPPTGSDKTSVLFVTAHKPGALFAALEPLSKNGINLTRIESRPIKSRPWEYAFFLDMQGHIDDPAMKEVLAEMQKHSQLLKILGSYPMGELEAENFA